MLAKQKEGEHTVGGGEAKTLHKSLTSPHNSCVPDANCFVERETEAAADALQAPGRRARGAAESLLEILARLSNSFCSKAPLGNQLGIPPLPPSFKTGAPLGCCGPRRGALTLSRVSVSTPSPTAGSCTCRPGEG